VDAVVQAGSEAGSSAWVRASRGRAEAFVALAAFAVLCLLALSVASQLVEPDDYAYRASTVAITQGHFMTLSTAQVDRLAAGLPGPGQFAGGPGGLPAIPQWVQLPDGRWISEKDPGYPFLAAPFQAAGIIRLAPLFYGALGCLGLFFGARRWLGRFGGPAAVALFCSSGAAMLFAWRDYMPTFTDASLIAAGTGALLWAVLAAEATARRRTWTGLAGFVALETAVFVRYTDLVVLGCAVVAVVVAAKPRAVPAAALRWWLGSVAVSVAGVALFDDLVYGGPLTSGYSPGEITFSLRAVPSNLRYMPAHLIQAMPMLVLAVAALAWIIGRRVRLRRPADEGPADEGAAAEQVTAARSDLAVGLALAASWFGVWGLYAAYTWTANPFGSTLQFARFYVPAIGAISLLGSWLVTRLPRRASLAAVTATAVAVAMFGLGAWSFAVIHQSPFRISNIRLPAVAPQQGPSAQPAALPRTGEATGGPDTCPRVQDGVELAGSGAQPAYELGAGELEHASDLCDH
jgi:hypothetical protein